MSIKLQNRKTIFGHSVQAVPLPGMRKQHGFTLLEALLGFFILSIGMLGVASLQAHALEAGKTSVYGSVAIMKVDELFESMRVNATGLATYAGDGTGENKTCTGVKECTTAELALDDLFWWSENLKAGLPAAVTKTITVTPAVAPSKMAVVKIDLSWKERNKDATGSVTKTYTTTTNICTDIPC